MTKEDFIENVTGFYDLREIARENYLDCLDDILFNDELSDDINYDLGSYADEIDWRELRDLLWDIDTSYDIYIKNGAFDYSECTDDYFEEYKQAVLDEMDSLGLWDDSDSDEVSGWLLQRNSEELNQNPEDSEGFEGSDFDIHSMLDSCRSEFQTIRLNK